MKNDNNECFKWPFFVLIQKKNYKEKHGNLKERLNIKRYDYIIPNASE